MNAPDTDHVPLRCGIVLRVTEQSCDVRTGDAVATARFAPQFPTPHTERVSPGHLVAVATAPDGDAVIVWRWFDAVVLDRVASPADPGAVRLWEPGHGEVVARTRPAFAATPGSRAYASTGLPGADWWVAGPVGPSPEEVDVELDLVDRLYTDGGLWDAALERTV